MEYIEFFGLPGSGKTTKLLNYKDGYYINGKPIGDGKIAVPTHKIVGAALMITNGKLFCMVWFIVKYHLFEKVTLKLMRASFNLYISLAGLKLNNKLTRVCVLNDNGFVQLLISILKRNNGWNDQLVKDYMQVFIDDKNTMKFVQIRTSPNLCLQRIYNREKSISIMRDGKERAREQLEHEYCWFDRCCRILLDSGLTVDTVE